MYENVVNFVTFSVRVTFQDFQCFYNKQDSLDLLLAMENSLLIGGYLRLQ